MATASKPNKGSHILSFSQRLFLSVISLFIAFAACFMGYQYQREKEYKIDLLDMQLQNCNGMLHYKLSNAEDSTRSRVIQEFADLQSKDNLRITIIDLSGDVLYDSYEGQNTSNHKWRTEIQKAIAEGKGYDVRRTSETTGIPYFYSATLYSHYIIRSAIPYNLNLTKHLAADQHYIWFALIVSLLLAILFYRLTTKLGDAIVQLREFAKRADKNQPIEANIQSAFPDNELGEISQHIIRIYKRLRETKEALYIEREKLITHLQTSREGLGVFNKDKKEILVNNLFTQYSNLISDHNLHTTEEIFAIDELQPITEFIDRAAMRPRKDEMRMSIVVNKNGRVFAIECIIFQDLSFEITINDTTQEEEQMLLKRQLTQNIAHELKTPVSSIQGYLETMVNNKNLPEEKMNTFVERCYAQSNRLSRLLRDISVLTRMDEAANMIDMEKVNIKLLVDNIVNEVSLDLEDKQIIVSNQLTTNIEISGNHSLLYSIFRNLMDNAIAYAGTGIHISINCFREDDNYFYFSFADTGTGVSQEHLSRLFERFYRVDKGRSRKIGGTGLGLAIVKNAVIIHGGAISAKNNQKGGLEFIFTLSKQK